MARNNQINEKPATKSALPENVAAIYTVRDGLGNVFACAEFGTVNLSEVTLAFALQLEEKGYLKKLVHAE
jgi:hypothetical protein